MTIRYYTASPYLSELKHSLYIISLCYDVTFDQVARQDESQITIGDSATDTLYFTDAIFKVLYSDQPYYHMDSMLLTVDGRPDYLSSIFYLVNCLQELNPDPATRDSLGRYDSAASLQVRNNVMQQNVVADFTAHVVASIPNVSIVKKSDKSTIFLSHDMDTIYGSLVQDSYWCLKRGDIAAMAQVMFTNLLQGPRWLNVDRIMAIESENDFKSTFFWMVKNGPTERGLSNSDYEITNSKVSEAVKSISDKGWHNGLHKSIGQATPFREELNALPSGVVSNRFHYLYFDTFETLPQIEEAGLKLDSSLGFAAEIGFRNSFSLPVHLFDIRNRKPFTFLECPLNCMDTTYLFYHKRTGDQFAKDVIDFVETNKTNSVLSILFHNNYISDHKFNNYLKAFKTVLAYFHESGYQSISEDEILKKYA